MYRLLNSMIMNFLNLFFNQRRATVFDIFFSYRLFLKRSPDNQGWNNYLTQKKELRISLDALIDAFLNSPEFLTKYGIVNEPRESCTYLTLPIQEEIMELRDFSIVIDSNDTFIGSAIKQTGEYEPHVTYVIESILKPGQTFVDIGANIGYFSLLAANSVGPHGKVIAFEPIEHNWSLFLKSIQVNGIDNIELHKMAIMDENKTVSMIQYERINSGSFHLLNTPHTNKHIYHVEGKRLDDILDNQSVNVIKIDVEGAEGLAFRGMIETIKKNLPIIIIEYTPLSLMDISKISGDEFLRAFEEIGYTFQDVESFKGRFVAKSITELNSLLEKKGSEHLDLIAFPNSIIRSS